MVLRVLSVAEKPSAAKEIVSILKRGAHVSTRRTRSRYNVIYEFDMQLQNQGVHMVFTSVLGHLKGTDFEQRVRRWGSVNPSVLLDPTASTVEWTVSEEMKPLSDTLRSEARMAQWLILWLDCDSEGEKIAFDVASVCREAKPSIVVKRAKFSAMTPADLHRAVNSLGVLNQRLVDMVATRQEIDLRAGSAFTRFLTTQLDKFSLVEGGDKTLVSYGPCQFPTLGLVVDRWLQIQNFVQRDFWVFELFIKQCDVPFEWTRKHLFDEYTAMLLYEICYEEAEADGYVATVERVQRRQRTRWRPLPLSTVELQKVASRVLRIASDRVMEIAESLYNKGLISYPRTETDRFAPSFDLRSIIGRQTSHGEWGQFASRLLTPPDAADAITFTWPRSGQNDDGAHPPIHPTAPAPDNFDSADHGRLYAYITKRFLASCSVDALGAETVVEVRVGSQERFTAQGLIVERRGYLEVMAPFEKWVDRQMPTDLLQVGARLAIESLLVRQSKTQPPPLLAEADLIALMDRHSIGTDATIAEHIKKVLERRYVEKIEGARFNPTTMGLSLVVAHERCEIHLARPHMRAKQEGELKRIVESGMTANQVLQNALTEYRALFSRLEGNRNTLDAVFHRRFGPAVAENWTVAVAEFVQCGVCDGRMALKVRERNGGGGVGGGGRGRGRAGGRGRGRGRGRGGAGGGVDGNGSDRSAFCAACDNTLRLPRNGRLAGSGKRCVICRYEAIEVTNESTGGTHTVCPKCYGEPPEDAASNPEGKHGEFRCFNCTRRGCELARGAVGGESDVGRCGRCGRACRLRRGRERGTIFVCCEGWRRECEFVYWFPSGVVEEVSVVEGGDGICGECGSKRFRVRWKAGRVPMGVAEFVGCVWCEGDGWRQVLVAIGEERSLPRAPYPRGEGGNLGDIEDGGGRGRGGRGRARGRATTMRTGRVRGWGRM